MQGYRRVLLLIICGLMLLLTVSCTAGQTFPGGFTGTFTTTTTAETPEDPAALPERGFFLGVLPVPAENQTFADAFQFASTCADFVPVWGRPTPFYNLADDLKGEWGKQFVQTYTRGNGMFPVVQMSFIGRDMELVSPTGINEPSLSHPVWREAYKKAVLNVVRAVHPLYLSLGNEVNRWYETYGNEEDDPNAFRHYVSLYNEIYDEVKAESPETRVFCTFAREMVNENRTADLDVFRLFDPDKLDAILLTSYPHSLPDINRPADIPDDYYTQVSRLFPGKRFGFTEAGWPSLDAFGGEPAQAGFLEDITGRLTIDQGIDLFMVGWPWLTDLNERDTMGLIRRDGTTKDAFTVWREIALLGKYTDPEASIPSGTAKMGPENDLLPPVLHSSEYEQPVPLPYPVNTAGAEDSPFMLPDGKTLYVWFTPDPAVPVEKQIMDGVTGIYVTYLQDDGTWSSRQRVVLNDDISLDGCVYVHDDTMWFASARPGYVGMTWFTAELIDDVWENWQYAGDNFPERYEIGELHFSADGKTLYFHSARDGGQGGYDIWVTYFINGEWTLPENLRTINSPENDGWPYLTGDGSELWFTRTYQGSPAIYVSRLVNGYWAEPELVISQFAGEPTLDAEGNIYFTHHYYRDGVMLEADIYVAYRK